MFQSTSLSRVATCENNTITGGAFSNNTLTLTKQGGGSVDIPFEGAFLPKVVVSNFSGRISTMSTTSTSDDFSGYAYFSDQNYDTQISLQTSSLGDALILPKISNTYNNPSYRSSRDEMSVIPQNSTWDSSNTLSILFYELDEVTNTYFESENTFVITNLIPSTITEYGSDSSAISKPTVDISAYTEEYYNFPNYYYTTHFSNISAEIYTSPRTGTTLYVTKDTKIYKQN